jgi:hypothetical protein
MTWSHSKKPWWQASSNGSKAIAEVGEKWNDSIPEAWQIARQFARRIDDEEAIATFLSTLVGGREFSNEPDQLVTIETFIQFAR